MFGPTVSVPGAVCELGQGTTDAGARKNHGHDEDGVAMPPGGIPQASASGSLFCIVG
jgi:hypothetical protein